MQRCEWPKSEAMTAYHDTEWGVPCRDDALLFEHLVLDGAQAGLSWAAILNRREGYRAAFAGFDPEKVARFTEKRQEKILAAANIIRNKAKVASAVNNARAFLQVRESHGSFSNYLWNFVDGKPIVNSWKALTEIPAETPLSVAISKDMKKRGFTFFGPVICYAYIQAVGLVNDHIVTCFRYRELTRGGHKAGA